MNSITINNTDAVTARSEYNGKSAEIATLRAEIAALYEQNKETLKQIDEKAEQVRVKTLELGQIQGKKAYLDKKFPLPIEKEGL